MKSISDYLNSLQKQLGQKQIRTNTQDLGEKIVAEQTGRLWNLSEDKKQYDKFVSLLNGSLKTVVDVSKLNISMLQNNQEEFRNNECLIILHDGSDLRKKYSKKLECLDKVRDLEGRIINGYPTFNSVLIDLPKQKVKLLQCTPYSSQDENYLSSTKLKDYVEGKLLKAEREEVEHLVESGNWYNHQTIVENHVKKIDESIRAVNPEATIVHIYDRGHDNIDLFEYHQKKRDLFVIRSKTNRNSNDLIINNKGEEVFVKLTEQQSFNGFEKQYDKIGFKGRIYMNVRGVFEWMPLELQGTIYHVLRVRMYRNNGHKLFKQPMLLITNMEINNRFVAELTFELYMSRSKIESVFKFCKNELGWEKFQVRKFEAIKNLIAFIYFIAGYFYEIEDNIAEHPVTQWLAQLGNGKGKTTSYYILRGVKKLYHFLEFQQMMLQQDNKTNMEEAIKLLFPNTKFQIE